MVVCLICLGVGKLGLLSVKWIILGIFVICVLKVLILFIWILCNFGWIDFVIFVIFFYKKILWKLGGSKFCDFILL